MATALSDIAAKIASGDTLDAADASVILATTDIVSIGMLADEVRRRRHGDRATFVRVADVPLDGPLRAPLPPSAGEVRIAGRPQSIEQAAARVRQVGRQTAGVPVSGFSLADVEALSAAETRDIGSLLEELREAGLELIAEAPIDLLHRRRDSLAAVSRAGLLLARVTVHRQLESGAFLALLRHLGELQRSLGCLRSFAPLARQGDPAEPSTGYDDVKRVALARLLLTGIESIQVDWARSGAKLAQVALTFGADDVDGVSPLETIEQGRRRAPLEEIRRNIRAASLTPVERDGRFEVLHR
jgi:aminodeoxyfutalosine synthase